MFTFLTAVASRDKPLPKLTKQFTLTDTGYTKTDYDGAYLYDANVIDDVVGVHEMALLLEAVADEPHSCLVRGEPIGPTENIRRALRDDPVRGPATIRPVAAGVPWVMIDFDKMPVASHGFTTNAQRLNYLASQLPPCFQEVTYFYQWSASAGLYGWDLLSCHLWFWLDQPWLCRDLYERFSDGDFKHCGVDPAPFTPNQPHYTAAPIFTNCPDPLSTERSGLVQGSRDAVTLPPWVKPVVPKPVFTPIQYHAKFPFSRFQELLADIGPGYHAEILKAIAHYCAVASPAEFDRAWLIDRIQEAIIYAPPGKNNKSDYSCIQYLNRAIDGAMKFRRVL